MLLFLCLGYQNASAQIDASCGNAKLYYYDLFGTFIGPAVTPKLTGGTMDNIPIAQAMANGGPAKFTGISSGLLTFSTPAGQEYYNYATGAFVAPVRPVKLLPTATPASPIRKTPWIVGVQTPHAGEPIGRDNPYFIDIYGDWAILLDGDAATMGDGSLSAYSYVTGKIIFDYTWIKFTGGGSLNNQAPSKANITAIENALIYHVNGNVIETYNLVTGVFAGNLVNPTSFAAAAIPGTNFPNPLLGISVGTALSGGIGSHTSAYCLKYWTEYLSLRTQNR